MVDPKREDEERSREARATLDRVARDSAVFGQSAVARAVENARAHMAADDADSSDPVEVWGRRIGRGLGAIAFVIVAIWLFNYLTR